MDDQAEVGVQIGSKLAHLFRLRSFQAAQPQWQADDDFANIVFRQQSSQSFQIASFILPLNRVQSLRRYAERVGDGHADSSRADIEGHDTANNRTRSCVHTSIVE